VQENACNVMLSGGIDFFSNEFSERWCNFGAIFSMDYKEEYAL
jgi:hypothetical protein